MIDIPKMVRREIFPYIGFYQIAVMSGQLGMRIPLTQSNFFEFNCPISIVSLEMSYAVGFVLFYWVLMILCLDKNISHTAIFIATHSKKLMLPLLGVCIVSLIALFTLVATVATSCQMGEEGCGECWKPSATNNVVLIMNELLLSFSAVCALCVTYMRCNDILANHALLNPQRNTITLAIDTEANTIVA